MLNKIFSVKNGIGIIIDKNKEILYSSSEEINNEFTLLDNLKDGLVDNIEFNSKNYKIAVSQSSGYREYHNDNIYSVVLVEK